MTEKLELALNAAGRMVPAMVNGRPQIPYIGVGKYQPRGRKASPPVRTSANYPENGDKLVIDLETALRKCGLRNGMVISSHHHLRDGDKVALMALETAARMGIKDVMWFPSASFPSQEGAIDLMESGAIHHIETLCMVTISDLIAAEAGTSERITDDELRLGVDRMTAVACEVAISPLP